MEYIIVLKVIMQLSGLFCCISAVIMLVLAIIGSYKNALKNEDSKIFKLFDASKKIFLIYAFMLILSMFVSFILLGGINI